MKSHSLSAETIKWTDEQLHTWKLESSKDKYEYIAVILHGAGTADSSRALGLAHAFADEGVSVISLDFIGHGKTGGDIKKLSLHKRTQQAMAAIQHWTSPGQKLILCGFSMSGHTVLRLTELLGSRVNAISLLCPAVYSKDAEEVAFTEEFTAILRRPGSWQDSPALNNARSFKGRAHVMIGASDPVIPWGVIEELLKSLRENADEIRLEVVTGVEHKLAVWLSSQPDRSKYIVRYLVG